MATRRVNYCPLCDCNYYEDTPHTCIGVIKFDDNSNDTQPKKSVVQKINEKEHNKIWNAAIDKCIEVANKYDSYGPAYEMRSLKK